MQHSDKLAEVQKQHFEIWFELYTAKSNPMLSREEAIKIFNAGYGAGFSTMLGEMLSAMLGAPPQF